MMNPSQLHVPNNPPLKHWDDLLPDPASETFDDLYTRLSPQQLQKLRDLNRISWLLETGKEAADGVSAQRANQIRQAFAQAGLDADWLLSQREAIRQRRIQRAYNPRMEGQSVRLFGQVLPLELRPDRHITQFLLTPWLPNCSHVPPPPSHQVVLVEAIAPIEIEAAEHDQSSTSLALWVEGTLRFAATNHAVYRIDGILQIGASYSVEPTEIAPATAQEVDQVFNRARREAEAILCPTLMDLVGDR
jgi:hypothetical protein